MTWQKLLLHISIAKLTTGMVTPQDFSDAVEKSFFPRLLQRRMLEKLFTLQLFLFGMEFL